MTSNTSFVILFLARSGSTWLSSLLSSHPDVFVDSEILVGKKTIAAQIKTSARSFSSNAGFSAAGIQSKLTDIVDLDKYDRFLLETGTKVIFLERKNVVKKAISYLNAVRLNEKTGKWNLYSEKDRQGKLKIDSEVFRERLAITDERRKWARDAVEQMKAPRLDLVYEDLLADMDGSVSPVFEYLGVEERKLESGVFKNTPDELASIVSNYEELRNLYKGTDYEKMFD